MKKCTFILLLVVLLFACSKVEKTTSVRKQIELINAKLGKWYAAGEIDSVAATFTTDARQIASNNPPAIGRDAIRDRWMQLTKNGTWNFVLETQDLSVSGSFAVERGKYTVSFTPGPGAPEGSTAVSGRGNYLVQWRKEVGKWLIVNDFAVSE